MADVQQETKPKSNTRKLSTFIKKRANTIRKSFIKSEKDGKDLKEQDKVDSDKSETISNADENTDHKQNGVESSVQHEERKTVRFADTETEQTEITEKTEPKASFLYQFGEFDESILDHEEEVEIVGPPPRKEAPKEQNLLFSYDSDSDNSSSSEKEDNAPTKQEESNSDEEVVKPPTPTKTVPTTMVPEPIAVPAIIVDKSETQVLEIQVQTGIEIVDSNTPQIVIVEPHTRAPTSEIEIQTDPTYDIRILITADEKTAIEISTQTDVSQLEEPIAEIKILSDSVAIQTEEEARAEAIEVNIGTDPIATSNVQVGTEKIATTNVRVGTERYTQESATSTELTSQDTTTDTTDLIHYEEKEIYTESVVQDSILVIEPEQQIQMVSSVPVSPSKGPRDFIKSANSVDELSTSSPLRSGSPLRVAQWSAATKPRESEEYDDLEVLYRPSVLANLVSKQRKTMTPAVDKDLVGMLRDFPENKSFGQKRK